MCRLYTPCAARMHDNARRRRVSHRTPALRPHRTDQNFMRVRRTHNREVKISTFSDPQKSGWGLAPRPGFAVLHRMHSVSIAMRATRRHAERLVALSGDGHALCRRRRPRRRRSRSPRRRKWWCVTPRAGTGRRERLSAASARHCGSNARPGRTPCAEARTQTSQHGHALPTHPPSPPSEQTSSVPSSTRVVCSGGGG